MVWRLFSLPSCTVWVRPAFKSARLAAGSLQWAVMLKNNTGSLWRPLAAEHAGDAINRIFKKKKSILKYCKGKEKKDRTLFFWGFIIIEAQQVPLWRTNLMLFYKKRKRNANHPKSSIQNWMTIFTHLTQKSKACWGFNCQFVPVCSSRDPNPETCLPPPAALI